MPHPPASSISPVGGLRAPTGRQSPRLEQLLARAELLAGRGLTPLLDLLLREFRASFVVLVRKNGKDKRQLVGRWPDGRDIGRPDKLIPPRQLQRVLRASTTRWAVDTSTQADQACHRTATFRVRLEKPSAGAMVFGWKTLPTWLSTACPLLDPRPLSALLGAVSELEEVKREVLGLRLRPQTPAARDALARRASESVSQHPTTADEELGSARDLRQCFPEILGDSPAIRDVLRAILRACRSDIPVLIEGESGTGKELVARAIHRGSPRHDDAFVWENCGAIPENLVETEFFGHERGAFTGAVDIKPGLFERARGGTVFLDEIGEMDPAMQKRLLRVLQEKEIRRVGGLETLPVDFRVVSATNRMLDTLVADRKFREDLYYRLNVVTISLPPLRERASDIPLLIENFSEQFAVDLESEPLRFTEEALAVLRVYSWPGNVRELRNEVLRLTSLETRTIETAMLSRRILVNVRLDESGRGQRRGQPLVKIEREVIGSAVVECVRQAGGNISEAARRLGITRSALYRRLRRYGLETSVERPEATGTG